MSPPQGHRLWAAIAKSMEHALEVCTGAANYCNVTFPAGSPGNFADVLEAILQK